MEILVKAPEAAKFYDISISNLRKLAREGKIKTKLTSGGHYRYIITKDIISEESDSELSQYIIYARVSSKKQEHDLERQIKFLRNKYPKHSLVRDIGSGINFKRKGFQTILDKLFKGDIKEVVVAYSDRFSRFGFEFFQWIFSKFGATLHQLEASSNSSEDELLSDVMEILTVFTARYHGRRKYNN
jgi:predicted site-specific integrase-resolvase